MFILNSLKKRVDIYSIYDKAFYMDSGKIYITIKKGITDFFRGRGFKRAIIGLSGGLDSSVVTFMLVDALGINNVMPVFLPTEFTSDSSRIDARKLCDNLDVELIEIDISQIFDCYLRILGNNFLIKGIEVPEENLQARIRADILMWLANRNEALVVNTGNRSEKLTGYCTLYGDTVGALSPIGNLYKTEVYTLARWLNKRKKEIIPFSIVEKKPSAELNREQYDEEDLYPYDILDRILKLHVDEGLKAEEIVEMGMEEDTVRDVIKRVRNSEFKRKYLPPAIDIDNI